jgi:hypothetical protein
VYDPRLDEGGQASAKAATDLAAAEQTAADLRKAKARLKKKVETQDLLYTSLRSELDVKKDRLRAQQEVIERLQALEVALGGTSAALAASDPELDPEPDAELDLHSDPDPHPDPAAGVEGVPEAAAGAEPSEVAE